jgi:hypothetical protein
MDDSNRPDTLTFENSEARTGPTPTRDAAIETKARKIPISGRGNYFRAARGIASPRQAIKAHCMECLGWNRHEVRNCTSVACPLYCYRPYQQD